MSVSRELSGVLTGALLIAALAGGVLMKFLSERRTRRQTSVTPSTPSNA